MKRGGGSQKGSAFERWVCKRLSEWAGGPDDLFWRTAGSGSRQTRGKHRTNQAGDVGALDPKVKWFTDAFYIECKFYRKFEWHSLLFKGRGNILNFWNKAMFQAAELERWPLLIGKENQIKPIIIFHSTMGLPLCPLFSLPVWDMEITWLEDILKLKPKGIRAILSTLKKERVRPPSLHY